MLEDVDGQVAAARQAGMAGVWVPEHHVAARHFLPPMQVLSWIAATHRAATLGTSVALPALHHPLHLAEGIATLALMTTGRVQIGFGTGFREREFAAVAVPYLERYRIARACADAVVALVRGEEVKIEAGPWRGERARLAARPATSLMFLWGATSRTDLRGLPAWCEGVLPVALAGIDGQVGILDAYDAARGSRAAIRPVTLDVVLGESRLDAEQRAERALVPEYRSWRHWQAEVPFAGAFATRPGTVMNELRRYAAVGTIDEVAEVIRLLEARGVTDVLLRFGQLGKPRDDALAEIRALGPVLRTLS